MQEGYLDQRLIGQRFIIKPTDLTDGVAFYDILYHLHAATPLHIGDTVEITAVSAHGLTVTIIAPQQ
ncbi:hypothetical protein [Lactiplantibacillus plantarum]|uniref:hypothetical protein n=1 Tax=Lactiplantibacillus plantarum TaxID=1590 RepID=UPI00107FF5C8|nr:hypothetical protein [Lactiplantibacillus plantarum]QBX95747.1 hypothetical protein DVH03_16220 [Lactiplantibacillus plantarum]